jgi:hypothetical protein
MSQVNAGSGDRTHTALRPRDFKSERGISSDNDLRADAPASVSIPSPVVYSRLRFAVTPGVTPSIEGSVKVRADCECTVCRAARGMEPLPDGELRRRRLQGVRR